MDFNIIEFANSLTLIQIAVFIVGVEIFEVLTGILNAWRDGKDIKSSITRKMIVDKFDSWKYILGFTMFALWIEQEAIAKMLLVFVVIPEITSVIENIVRSVMKNGNDN